MTGQLLRETKGRAKISAVQFCVPSATKFGMSALLPHTQLQLTDDLKVLCDGEATDSTASERKDIKKGTPGQRCLDL